MTEVEQLRKEVNELRERLARLEARPQHAPVDLSRYQQPVYVGDPILPVWRPPYEITCTKGGPFGNGESLVPHIN